MRALRNLIACTLLVLLAVLASPPASADPSPVAPAAVDVVPGVAIAEANGSTTFTGGGFAPHAPLQLTLNGSPAGTTQSTSAGAFSVPLTLTGVGAQSLSASGHSPDGRVHVVTASVILGQAELLAPNADVGSSSTMEVYRALAGGLVAVVLAILVILAARLLSRVSAART